MNNPKQIIERIKSDNSNYPNPTMAQNQANSLESLSSDIYTDSKRFIYELLQNADDASAKFGKLDLHIAFVDNYIVISHQGEPFSEVDIESICSVGDGNKKGDDNKTGFKGIGFKSVFSHSDYVMINTGDFCFKFDKNAWTNYWGNTWLTRNTWDTERKKKNKDILIKMPWQIIPLWSELPPNLNFVKKYNVSTIIRHHNIKSLETELLELLSNTQVLLFLRSKEVRVSITGHRNFSIDKIQVNDTVHLRKNEEIQSEWLIKTFDFSVDDSTRQLIENDTRIPKKLRQIKRTEISFAVQLEKGKIKVADSENRLIFTYLPTSVNYDFPFLLNANFITDAGRQQIHEDLSWNIWLFKQIPQKLFEWLGELAISRHQKSILKLIPNQFKSNNKIKTAFDKGFEMALATTKFLPTKAGELVKAKDAILDLTGLSEKMYSKTIIRYCNSKYTRQLTVDSFITYLYPPSVLKQLGVQLFDESTLLDFLTSKLFQEKYKVQKSMDLISFLYELSTTTRTKGFENSLKSIPFLFDENEVLQSPTHIYFPSVKFSESLASDINIIHSAVLNEVQKNSQIKKWLQILGVSEPTSISFIEKSLLRSRDYVTKENAIAVGKYLFKAYKDGKFQSWYFSLLADRKLLTKNNNLITASEAFLSNKYEPKLELEELIDEDIFISEDYIERQDLVSEWKTFFLKMKVNEKFKEEEYDKKTETLLIEKFKLNYLYFSHNSRVNGGYPITSYKINRITFIEKTIQYQFSLVFWEYVINNLSPSFLIFSTRGYWGFSGWGGQRYGEEITNYNKWLIQNTKCIPTTFKECRKPSDVFINSPEIMEYTGSFFPRINLNQAISEEWADYLGLKKSLTLKHYLLILAVYNKKYNKNNPISTEEVNRIKLIYEKLSEEYLDRTEELKEWGTKNKILSKNKKGFYTPNELSIIKVSGFRNSKLAFGDNRNKKIVQLLKIFGVRVIDKIEAKASNDKIKIQSLKNRLLEIAPLIAVIAVMRATEEKEWQKEFSKIKSKIKEITFYQVGKLYLTYGNDNDKLKRSTFATKSNFYFVGNWQSPRVLDGLIEPLSKYLGIKYAERELTVLLLESYVDGVEFLKEKFATETLGLPEKKLTIIEKTPSTVVSNRPYNESDEEIGRQGELFVYQYLKEFYTQKYKASIIETTKGFKIDNKIEVFWVNMKENTNTEYDFKIVKNEKVTYIDSKATRGGYETKEPFRMSINELNLMEKAENYLIARVFNVISNPTLKFIQMDLFHLE